VNSTAPTPITAAEPSKLKNVPQHQAPPPVTVPVNVELNLTDAEPAEAGVAIALIAVRAKTLARTAIRLYVRHRLFRESSESIFSPSVGLFRRGCTLSLKERSKLP